MQEKLQERHAMPNQPAAIKFYIREIRVFKLGTVLEYFIDDDFKLLVRQIIWYLWSNAKYNID
jgi:hypothetical protein